MSKPSIDPFLWYGTRNTVSINIPRCYLMLLYRHLFADTGNIIKYLKSNQYEIDIDVVLALEDCQRELTACGKEVELATRKCP